ncbi:MAG: ferritin, partial [Chloroflexi bacterium]|nr:ferritin [Chloroflexota bacterium]
MLSKRLQDAINEQIKNELYSAYMYQAMGAYAESKALRGISHWMSKQAQEEVSHAMKFYKYVHERGGRVELKAIEQPPLEYGTPLEIFNKTLEHEQLVT